MERFNRTQPGKLDGRTIDELIEQFKSIREDTISIVRKMSENDLDREGRHAFHGNGKLERFIQMLMAPYFFGCLNDYFQLALLVLHGNPISDD